MRISYKYLIGKVRLMTKNDLVFFEGVRVYKFLIGKVGLMRN